MFFLSLLQTAANCIKFETYGKIADEAYSCYNDNMLDSQDFLGQTESGKIVEAKYSNYWDNEDKGSNINFEIPSCMSRNMVDGEFLESINPSHSSQC